jgi:AcrR family transcriptional regulator
MTPRDPEAKQRKLLDAGLAEFAAYGIAGARVDRIAKRAEVSAGLVYTHFGSKEALFEAVYNHVVVEAVNTMPLDPTNLPAYAGKLFDAQTAHPDVMRLSTWYRLEHRDEDGTIESLLTANSGKIATIAEAQRTGVLSDKFEAAQLLLLVIHTASLWSSLPKEMLDLAPTELNSRRATVVEAVRCLIS